MKRSYKIAIIVSILVIVFVISLIGVLLLTRSNQTSDNPISAPVSQAESQPEETNVDKLKGNYNTIYLKDHEIYLSNFKTGETSKFPQIGNLVQDFVFNKERSKIYYTVSDAEIFGKLKTDSVNLINTQGSSMFQPSVKLEEIDNYKDTSVKLLSYDLETGEIETLVDFNNVPMNKDDLYMYYATPYHRQSVQILALSEDGNKLIYASNGVWVYNFETNLKTLIDSSENAIHNARSAFMGTNLLSIRYASEGRSEKIFRLDGSQYNELPVKGIVLSSPVGKDTNDDDVVIGINKEDKIIVLEIFYAGANTHNYIFSIDKNSGEATKLFDTGFGGINACGAFKSFKILLKTCDPEHSLAVFQIFNLAGETIGDLSSLNPQPTFREYWGEEINISDDFLGYTLVDYGDNSKITNYNLYAADVAGNMTFKVADSKTFGKVLIFD